MEYVHEQQKALCTAQMISEMNAREGAKPKKINPRQEK